MRDLTRGQWLLLLTLAALWALWAVFDVHILGWWR